LLWSLPDPPFPDAFEIRAFDLEESGHLSYSVSEGLDGFKLNVLIE